VRSKIARVPSQRPASSVQNMRISSSGNTYRALRKEV
jgi:hypothetical protein